MPMIAIGYPKMEETCHVNDDDIEIIEDNFVDVGVKLEPNAKLPRYQTSGSVGMDLHAYLDYSVDLSPMERRLIPTGVALELPYGTEGNIRGRSGLMHKQGLFVFEGSIDVDFRASLMVSCINLSNALITIYPGDRIAQLVISPVLRANLVVKDELSPTQRGSGGFGHTGIK